MTNYNLKLCLHLHQYILNPFISCVLNCNFLLNIHTPHFRLRFGIKYMFLLWWITLLMILLWFDIDVLQKHKKKKIFLPYGRKSLYFIGFLVETNDYLITEIGDFTFIKAKCTSTVGLALEESGNVRIKPKPLWFRTEVNPVSNS